MIAAYFLYPYINLYNAKNLDNLSFTGKSISLNLEKDIPFSELACYLFDKKIIQDTIAFNLLVKYKNYNDDTLFKSKIGRHQHPPFSKEHLPNVER